MRSILLRGATVLTMDEHIGDVLRGDILVRGTLIEAVGADLPVPPDADIVDTSGAIVCPGFVNAHMHTWQTNLRGVAANWTLLEYFRWVHRGLATLYAPDDIGISTLVGALGQLNAGTTTLGDWCHNNPTPAHTDAAVAALHDSGIRAVFLHGTPKPDPRPGEPHFSEVPHPRHEVERLLRGELGCGASKVTLGMAILGPHYSTLEVSRHDLRLARELGLIASMHQGGGTARTPGGWEALADERLLGGYINIVHGNDLSDELLDRFVEAGVTFSVAPENEMTQGHGHPITGRLLKRGVAPSIGIDLESIVSSGMPAAGRMALACQRALDNAHARAETGSIPETSTVPTRQAMEWITLAGARALGLADRIGSITPGKQADLVVVRADRLGVSPMHDPYSTVLLQADTSHVDSVMVAGEFVKKSGRLLRSDVGELLHQVSASGSRILAELGVPSAQVTRVSRRQAVHLS